MGFWNELVLFNTAGAVLLSTVAAIVGSRLRRPAIAHTIWLVVLLKLVSVPAFELKIVPSPSSPVLPGPEPPGELARSAATALPATGPVQTEPASLRAAVQTAIEWLFPILAAAGLLAVILAALLRIRNFRRHLADDIPVPRNVRSSVNRVAARIGLRRPPHIKIVAACISPSLWRGRTGCTILLPRDLSAALSPEEFDTLIAHELAHIRRGDHWVRPFELVVTGLCWWNPVALWARHRLRIEEERACDAAVLSVLPASARVYAEALLKTAAFVTAGRAPALATEAVRASTLKERITMIIDRPATHGSPSRWRPAVLVLALAALLVTPAWMPSTGAPVESPPSKQELGRTNELDRRELELQRRLYELEARRMSVQQQIEDARFSRELARIRFEIKQLIESGQDDAAAALEVRLRRMENEAEQARRIREFETTFRRRQADLEFELKELLFRRAELLDAGDDAAAGELTERVQAIERELRELAIEALQQQIDNNKEFLEKESRELQELRSAR